MVRVPCCEKMGMKKGPWTPEEDQVLVDYIQGYGHGNWRALPRHAGLLRCGKSCRLRWTNYLRPDIKRGNFSTEEEETIIELHGMLGNRWSAIAAKLPGRTDNEIKNVWHTHLKKRVALREKQDDDIIIFSDAQSIMDSLVSDFEKDQQQPAPEYYPTGRHDDQARSDSTITTCHVPISPQQSCSDDISISTSMNNNISTFDDIYDFSHSNMFNNDSDSFWSDVLSSTTSSAGIYNVPGCEFPLSPLLAMEPVHASTSSDDNNGLLDVQNDMDFWYHVFKRAEEYSADFPGI